MKRILLFLSALFIATTAIAHTINWYVDGSVYHTTTCESGEDVTPPTAPEKYGYTFKGWKSYTPIEYLESTGTQWINSGFVPTNNTRIEFEYAFSVAPYNDVAIFGSRTDNDWNNSNDQLFVACKTLNTGLYVYSGTTKFTIQSTIVLNTFYKRIVDNSKATETGTRPIYLYAINNKGTASGLSQIKIKYLKVFNNNVIVRDFIPVLDKNGVPCMYDLVEHKFYYNAGTGDFIAGPIVGE